MLIPLKPVFAAAWNEHQFLKGSQKPVVRVGVRDLGLDCLKDFIGIGHVDIHHSVAIGDDFLIRNGLIFKNIQLSIQVIIFETS